MNVKNLLSILLISAFASSCGPDYKAEVDRMIRERDSLMTMYDNKDSLINSYMQDINEIQSSIAGLVQQEETLARNTANDPEASLDSKAAILNDIESIRELIDKNQKKLSELQAKVRRSNIKIKELDNVIANLNQQLAQRDSSINSMNEKIASLSGTISTMEGEISTIKADNAQKLAEIQDKTTRLNTAYYTIGSYKELRDKKVITKEGGFLGIGKQKEVLPDFNQEVFTRVDRTSMKSIPLTAKEAQILSTHPSGSFNLIKDESGKNVTSLEITDPENFWKASKYLVVVTE